MTWQHHTSGPWEAIPPEKRGGMWTIRIAGAKASAGAIARIPFTENKPVEANARLMAAAPDLLTALENIMEMNPGLPMGMAEAAEQAIRNARGAA